MVLTKKLFSFLLFIICINGKNYEEYPQLIQNNNFVWNENSWSLENTNYCDGVCVQVPGTGYPDYKIQFNTEINYFRMNTKQSISQKIDLGHSGNGTLSFSFSLFNDLHNNSKICDAFSFQIKIGDLLVYDLNQNNESIKNIYEGYGTYTIPVTIETEQAGEQDIKLVFSPSGGNVCEVYLTINNVNFYYRNDVLGTWFTIFWVFDSLIIFGFLIFLCWFFCHRNDYYC